MELDLERVQMTPEFTIGRLYLNNLFECFICEDAVRIDKGEAKIPGKTAIPAGRYQVVVTMSNRFKRLLPLLVNVPQFEGIRIHPGNTSADTEGCLLPGVTRLDNGVGQSRFAFDRLFDKIKAPKRPDEKIYINVINGELL